jgi:hypothetical protein
MGKIFSMERNGKIRFISLIPSNMFLVHYGVNSAQINDVYV